MGLTLKKLLSTFISFVYPPTCIHCRKMTAYDAGSFCPSCIEQLEIVQIEDRCPYCFSSDYDNEKRICYPCFVEKPVLKKVAAAFDYIGPAASLVTKMKYANQPYLAKGAGAYMAIQFLELKWPEPDYIIPVPLIFSHQLTRGYNQSLLLAQSLGKILQKPVKDVLGRRLLDVSQAGMNRKQRVKLTSQSFYLKKALDLQDKTILLIDDVYTTGRTLNCCAEVLYEAFPTNVYGLTLCRAI